MSPRGEVRGEASQSPARPSANGASSTPGATSARGGYYMEDGPGTEPAPDHRAIPNASPRNEPLSLRANRPYAVFGQNYVPMTTLKPYQQRGTASWYGRKFHGQKTANGETYDMYAMTAAHPTLPLPSFARVTNLNNGEQIVVRVNDRGPFLHGRIIDLSYTAASKLGYVQTGRAEVEVELITLRDTPPAAVPVQTEQVPDSASIRTHVELVRAYAIPMGAPVLASESPRLDEPPEERLQIETVMSPRTYLQLGAFGSRENADAILARVRGQLDWLDAPIAVVGDGKLFKIQAGPFEARDDANVAAERIRAITGSKPYATVR